MDAPNCTITSNVDTRLTDITDSQSHVVMLQVFPVGRKAATQIGKHLIHYRSVFESRQNAAKLLNKSVII